MTPPLRPDPPRNAPWRVPAWPADLGIAARQQIPVLQGGLSLLLEQFLKVAVFRVAVGCRTQARHHMPSRRTTSPGPRHHSVDADFRLLAPAVNLARWLSTGCEEPPEDGRWHSRLAAPATLLNQPFDTYVAHLTPDLDTASGRCCLPPIRSPNTPCIVDESDHYDDLAGAAGPPDCADPSGCLNSMRFRLRVTAARHS
jgi:hypothetical protein